MESKKPFAFYMRCAPVFNSRHQCWHVNNECYMDKNRTNIHDIFRTTTTTWTTILITNYSNYVSLNAPTTYFYSRMWEKYVDAKCLYSQEQYLYMLGSYISAPSTRIYRFVIAGGAFVLRRYMCGGCGTWMQSFIVGNDKIHNMGNSVVSHIECNESILIYLKVGINEFTT